MTDILDGHGTPYEALKALQQAIRESQGRKPAIKDLLVLAVQNDPFYSGTVSERARAKWFAEVFGSSRSVHIRRVHYSLVARGDVMTGRQAL